MITEREEKDLRESDWHLLKVDGWYQIQVVKSSELFYNYEPQIIQLMKYRASLDKHWLALGPLAGNNNKKVQLRTKMLDESKKCVSMINKFYDKWKVLEITLSESINNYGFSGQ